MIRFGLVGCPLDHSLSPTLHNAALRASHLQGEYLLFRVEQDDFPGIKALLDQVRRGELLGLNITIPHKQNIIRFLDALTPVSTAIGAVNTVYLDSGKLVGDNTDAPAFINDLNNFLHSDRNTEWELGGVKKMSALILGAGGAARAVVYALSKAGWKITVAARRIEQAAELAARYAEITTCNILNIAPRISSIHLVVNTTPVGMFPDTHASPWIDGLPFPKEAAVYDLVYNPRETMLVKQAQAAGLRASTAIGMLVEQATLAFQIWTGQDIPRRIMFDAINMIHS